LEITVELTIKLDAREVQLAIDAYLKTKNLSFILTKVTTTQEGEVIAECSEFKSTTPQR
jgi:hypothetical protein